jgi:hypothetical protein
MDVNLCVGVGHNMPLLRSYRDLDSDNYKDFAPTERDLDLPNVQTPEGVASSAPWSLDIFLVTAERSNRIAQVFRPG